MTENEISDAQEVLSRLTLTVARRKRIPKDIGIINMVLGAINTGIQSMEKLKEYLAIGNVEECRAAAERIKPRKPIEYEDKYYGCPKCGNPLMRKWEKYPTTLTPKSQGMPCCLSCQQAIDWSEGGAHE